MQFCLPASSSPGYYTLVLEVAFAILPLLARLYFLFFLVAKSPKLYLQIYISVNTFVSYFFHFMSEAPVIKMSPLETGHGPHPVQISSPICISPPCVGGRLLQLVYISLKDSDPIQ